MPELAARQPDARSPTLAVRPNDNSERNSGGRMHVRRTRTMWATLSLTMMAAWVGAATPARAQLPAPSRCAVGIPQDETSGYVPLPRGDVFCPLLADPKGQR